LHPVKAQSCALNFSTLLQPSAAAAVVAVAAAAAAAATIDKNNVATMRSLYCN